MNDKNVKVFELKDNVWNDKNEDGTYKRKEKLQYKINSDDLERIINNLKIKEMKDE